MLANNNDIRLMLMEGSSSVYSERASKPDLCRLDSGIYIANLGF